MERIYYKKIVMTKSISVIRIIQLLFSTCAIVLPVKMSLVLDESNFRDKLSIWIWVFLIVVIFVCFVLSKWTREGYSKFTFRAGVFGSLNLLLLLAAPAPSASIYWIFLQLLKVPFTTA